VTTSSDRDPSAAATTARDAAPALDTPPLPDYHTHTVRCGHAEGTPAEYVAAAKHRGLDGIGISDHVPLLHVGDPHLAMPLDALHDYVEEVTELKQRDPHYVLLGIEVDFRPDTFDRMRELLRAYPFDYVIGSVHYLDGWGFDDPRHADGWTERNVDDVYTQYFEQVGDAAESGVFTILGHLDLVKKWGHRPMTHPVEAVARLSRRIAKSGAAVEVNASGLRKPVGEIYPSAGILSCLREHGVPVTFGSDAHRPQDVGRDFASAARLAWDVGYRDYVRLVADPEGGRARVTSRPLPRPAQIPMGYRETPAERPHSGGSTNP
jgi:histidinol-phosphatase (PHP family)